ncbi:MULTISPECIES: carbohydrate ABC transporter permease [Paenibacillus]|uniref:Raffinose/stachyose/melibiose transport system permease protein n=1 Tax=Paenibacillus barengoltzii J12 TaxID=935846 RepID=A0ABY1LZG6_9BACL|nr:MULTISPECIES: carbohydrate ABC transporter permease [Paenibacillus]MDU0331243.1 carbohydrate ABC transporter permease [Paenibacillus sp. 3LSP]MEC2342589.1 carbohydrate ABC transporter permease [Paenibacillus barengoltzii]SMF19744.1 raffinose/stachyose/melibiose transport system permease protein [Paenibacillus barengoltzii J12]
MNTAEVRLPKRVFLGKFLLQFFLIIVAFVQVYPLIWLAFFSLKDNSEIFSGDVAGFPKKLLWSNYTKALSDGNVMNYFGNSVLVTAASIILVLILSSMAAYAITRMNWKLSNATMTLILLGMMVPIHAALLPLFMVLKSLHLLNTYWSLIIPYVAFGIPMAVFILGSFFKGVPRELEESAVMDGCGVYRTYFSIILPLIRPAIATVSIFTFLSCWNELMFAVTFINDTHYQTLTVGMMSMVGTYITQWGIIGAGLMITTIPTVIIYLLLNKQVQQSMIAGAVKG